MTIKSYQNDMNKKVVKVEPLEKAMTGKPRLRHKPVKYLRKEGDKYIYKTPSIVNTPKGLMKESAKLKKAYAEIKKLLSHYEKENDRLSKLYDKAAEGSPKSRLIEKEGMKVDKMIERVTNLGWKLGDKAITVSNKLHKLGDKAYNNENIRLAERLKDEAVSLTEFKGDE